MGYENGKIYVLRSNQTDDIYIGSTTQPLYKRIHQHKKCFNRWKNGNRNYVTSFELIKYDDVYIELLELCPCSSKIELHKREGEFIRSMKCVNKNVAGRTDKEYYEENKDKISEQMKEYYEENKEKIKEYREENKDKISEHHKEWREENKEKIKEYKKEWYEANKDKIAKRTKKNYDCSCGGKYTHTHKSRHLKSQKHTNYIISTNNTE